MEIRDRAETLLNRYQADIEQREQSQYYQGCIDGVLGLLDSLGIEYLQMELGDGEKVYAVI